MVGPVKEFLRRAELAVREFHLPSRSRYEGGFFLIVASISHVDDYRVSVIKYTPARNRGTFHIKLYKIRAIDIQIAHIESRLARHAFESRAESDKIAIRRNIRMIYVDGIRNFNHRESAAEIVDIGQVSRKVIPKSKLCLIGTNQRMDSR